MRVLTSNLAAALVKAQAELPALHKDQTAEVVGKTKDGKPYKYSYGYLSLPTLLDAVVPTLNKNGIALIQAPTFLPETGGLALKTVLIHGDSGETFEAVAPLKAAGTPQDIGGEITYARRYAITSLLGIAAEDDDGATARKAKRPTPKHADNGLASQAQKNRLHAIISELAGVRGVPSEQVRDALKGALKLDSFTNMTAVQAKQADDLLESWKKKVAA